MPTFGAWPLRVLWLVLPVTAGPCLADALARTGSSFQLVASVGLWVLWAAALVAMFIPLPVTLTIVRVVAPAAPFAAAWAAIAGADLDASCVVALVVTTLAAVASLLARTGDVFIDGASYGSERRFGLRPPAPLLVGPIELAWAAAVAGLTAGPLLLAAENWWAGAVVLVLGLPIAVTALVVLHGLSQRWIVFVPAGLVLHDPMTLQDAVLVPTRSMRHLGALPGRRSGREARPPTLGIALEVELAEPVSVGVRRGEVTNAVDVERLAFSPSLPGRLLDEARARQMPVA